MTGIGYTPASSLEEATAPGEQAEQNDSLKLSAMSLSGKKWPTHGSLGLALVAIFWSLNWLLPGLRTHILFFPLWLGYCLTVDALVFKRKGTSLLTRNPRAYAGLFLISAPCWWLFDLLNFRLQNWAYLGMDITGSATNVFLATLSFSTVVPAVFGSAELASTFYWIQRLKAGPRIAPTLSTLFSSPASPCSR